MFTKRRVPMLSSSKDILSSNAGSSRNKYLIFSIKRATFLGVSLDENNVKNSFLFF